VKLLLFALGQLDALEVAFPVGNLDPEQVELLLFSLAASRQAYLGKREQQQLDLLRIEIADWERDFKGVKSDLRFRVHTV
jgi:hypothetical protein